MEIIRKRGNNMGEHEKKTDAQAPAAGEQELVSVPEIEGGNYTYYWVCSECHGMIIWNQKYCKWCKRRIDWNG